MLPQSPQANIIIGLDLLRLLVENRIAEFHTELELLSPEVCAMHLIPLPMSLHVGFVASCAHCNSNPGVAQ